MHAKWEVEDGQAGNLLKSNVSLLIRHGSLAAISRRLCLSRSPRLDFSSKVIDRDELIHCQRLAVEWIFRVVEQVLRDSRAVHNVSAGQLDRILHDGVKNGVEVMFGYVISHDLVFVLVRRRSLLH